MQWLPPIGPETASVRLPISAVGAWEATAALASDDLDEAQALWKRVLHWEPALLFWTVGRAGHFGALVHSIDEGASWLADARDEAWRDVAPPDELNNSYSRRQALTWARRVARALGRSRTASHEIDANSLPETQACALLAEASQWLSAASPDHQGWLPAWHCQRIGALRESERNHHHLRQKVGASSDQFRRKVRRRWLVSKAVSSTSFLSVITRLAKARELEAAFAKRLHEEKLASLAQLAYGATHEINNPLANIATRAQSLLVDETHPERRRTLATIHSQAMRAYEMIANMMLFARPPALQCEVVEGLGLLKEAVESLSEEAAAQQTQVHIIADGNLTLWGDRRQLIVALRASLQNALEALGAGGEIRLAARRVTQVSASDAALPIEIAVSDSGPGLDAKTLRHAFDPFFSGRESGRGLGFGLSWCWSIVAQHGGTVELTNQEHGGTRLVMRLPEKPPGT